MRYWWMVGWMLALLGLGGCRLSAQSAATPVPIIPIGAPTAAPPQEAPIQVSAPTSASVTAPDLGRILFARGGQLWEWTVAGVRQITTQGNLSHPALAPDGRTLAAVERGESYSDIVVFMAGQSAADRLTTGISSLPLHSYERVFDTTWSSYPSFIDPSTLVYAGQAAPPGGSPAAEYRLSLYEVAVETGGRAQLWARSDGDLGRIAAAPDGTLILAFAPTGDADPALLRYDPRLGDASPLANALPNSYDPAVAIDGTIAYAHRDAGTTDVYLLPVGAPSVRLTEQETARAPTFSPDGRILAYLAAAPDGDGFDLWTVVIRDDAGKLVPPVPQRRTTDGRIDADSGLTWGR